MAEIPFEGFAVDTRKADAVADAIAAVFEQADRVGLTTPNKLAALGIAAARVLFASQTLRDRPDTARRLAEYIVAQLTAYRAGSS